MIKRKRISLSREKIANIEVGERIRRDMGDVEALAKDIQKNGLINPISVAYFPEGGRHVLIAGERRLEAMKLLGEDEIDAHVFGVWDADDLLALEIAENEARKDFTPAERVEYGKRLEKIERLKARDRQSTSTGGANPQLVQNFAEAEKPEGYTREEGRSRDKVAEMAGFGSGEQYRKAKTVYDEAPPEVFDQWNQGAMSTHKAFTITKEREASEETKERNARIDREYGMVGEIDKFFRTVYKAINGDTFSDEAIETFLRLSVGAGALMDHVKSVRDLMDHIEAVYTEKRKIRRVK